MKTELATIVIALAGANAFVIPSTTQKALSTKLNGKASYEWAYDAFGTVGPENNYYQGSGDQNNDQIGSGWAHDPWGGVSQTDFFPMVCEQMLTLQMLSLEILSTHVISPFLLEKIGCSSRS